MADKIKCAAKNCNNKIIKREFRFMEDILCDDCLKKLRKIEFSGAKDAEGKKYTSEEIKKAMRRLATDNKIPCPLYKAYDLLKEELDIE